MIERVETGLYRRPMPKKLTPSDVEEILTCGGLDTPTAARFGVSQVMVTRIRAGKAWRSVYDRVILGKTVRLSTKHGLARAWRDCYRVTDTGCFEWTGATDKDGYGVTFPNRSAHREAYIRAFGSIARDLCVCHRCDNRRCVNPAHLFLGTNADNTADMVAKHRQARGSKNGLSKLTETQVRKILRDARSGRQIAHEYGVTPRVIYLIRHGETWKHVVPDPEPVIPDYARAVA